MARRLANGMKSLAARFALREPGLRPQGRVLAGRFHHVLKRTPAEVRRALAYVLLNARGRQDSSETRMAQGFRLSRRSVTPLVTPLRAFCARFPRRRLRLHATASAAHKQTGLR